MPTNEQIDRLLEALSYPLLGMSSGKLALAFLFILGGFALSRLTSGLVARINRAGTMGPIRRLMFSSAEKPSAWVFILVGIWLAIGLFPLPVEPINIRLFTLTALQAASVALATWFAVKLTDGLCGIWEQYASTTETQFDDQLVPIIRKSSKVFLWIAGGVMVIQNLGYSVGSLLAGLGLGGAALALASKDTIANLFGSIVIFLDRPFYVGDWIEIGEKEGVVEEVGLRVTRLRTFANSVITIPNSQLTTMTINNWSRMKKRRVMLTLGLTYDTDAERMAMAVEAIRDVLRNDSRIHQDFFLVNFTEMGAYSLDILVYCFTVTTDWAEHLQVRQELLLKFMLAIENLGLSFAFPTRTLHLAAMPDGSRLPHEPEAMRREFPA